MPTSLATPRRRWLAALLVLGTGPLACHLQPEPLRAGWLKSGVYAYPPPAKCPPKRPPGVPFGGLSGWKLPELNGWGSVEFTLPWLSGRGSVQWRTAGSLGARSRVSSFAMTPYKFAEGYAAAQLPGFAAGVDLRGHRHVAFVADTSGWMCDYARCNGDTDSNLPAPLLQVMGDQIDAAIAGMRPDQRVSVYAGSSWRTLHYAPTSAAGRGLAGEFVRGQVCTGARGVRGQFRQAIQDGADLIVLFTNGGLQPRDSASYEASYTNCTVAPSQLYCYVDDHSEAITLAALADGARVPPVVAVTVQRHEARWLQNLAEATGGVYVDIAP